MNVRNFLLSSGALVFGLAVFIALNRAQSPPYDQVNVNLPYTVRVGGWTLQPGNYVIRQMPSTGDNHVVLIYSDSGTKFGTSVRTIPTVNHRTPEDTKVLLHHFGPDYYFDKIWIQGKDYGYEFPLPNSVKEHQKERMEPLAVAATYQAVPAETKTETAQVAPVQKKDETAQAAPVEKKTETAPAAPPEQPAPAPPAAQNQPPAAASTPAATKEAKRQMPVTAANWVLMLLSGGLLSGAGLALRRKP